MTLTWNNLTKDERAEYMRLQMTPYGNVRSGYLPDDCGDCNVCGQPVFGYGWCRDCTYRYNELRDKLEGIKRRKR